MNNSASSAQPSRRDLIKTAALAGAGTALAGLASGCAELVGAAPSRAPVIKPRDTIRIGFVGIGGMGGAHFNNLLRIEGVEFKAVCDIRPERTNWASQQVEKAGKPKPVAYTKGPEDYKRMCETEDLDLVYTATPWQFHVPVCVAAMKSGKHAVTEVPAAMTVEDSWLLVETAEKTGKHCQIMENCCYDRPELMVLNMIRKGIFGTIVHGECGYLHDLRGVKFSGGGEGLWRREWATRVDANLYPTHGIGPMAWYMDINRGDRFDYLVSMSSPSRGLQEFAEHLPADDPRRKEKYVLGDVNTSLIKTAKGLTIMLQHDTNLPRPYSRINLVHGTKGIFRGYPDQIYIEGRSKDDAWESTEAYHKEFDHPVYKAMTERAKGAAGHGAMDYIEDYRMIQALRKGVAPDIDVYDAAAWSVIVDLTRKSVANKSRPVDFPDFTRGAWKTAKPVELALL